MQFIIDKCKERQIFFDTIQKMNDATLQLCLLMIAALASLLLGTSKTAQADTMLHLKLLIVM